MYGIQGVPQSLCGRAYARDDVAAVQLAACCFFQFYFGFCTAAPTARHLLQSFSQGYLTARHKGMASSADLEIQCLADAAAYIERHGWPRSRLEGWRCAPVPRVSNPAHWDPYATVSPPSRHRRDSRITQVLDQSARGSREEPQVRPRAGRGLCAVQGLCGAAAAAWAIVRQGRARLAR